MRPPLEDDNQLELRLWPKVGAKVGQEGGAIWGRNSWRKLAVFLFN